MTRIRALLHDLKPTHLSTSEAIAWAIERSADDPDWIPPEWVRRALRAATVPGWSNPQPVAAPAGEDSRPRRRRKRSRVAARRERDRIRAARRRSWSSSMRAIEVELRPLRRRRQAWLLAEWRFAVGERAALTPRRLPGQTTLFDVTRVS